jgi:hypothetical protein
VTVHRLPTGTEGLPEASRPRLVELADGDEFELEPDRCPKCGMKPLPTSLVTAGGGHGHEHHGHAHGSGHEHEAHHGRKNHHGHHDKAQGIGWEDDMVEVNRTTTPENVRWKLVDRETGAENAQIDWTFHVGDQVKLRLVNEMDDAQLQRRSGGGR